MKMYFYCFSGGGESKSEEMVNRLLEDAMETEVKHKADNERSRSRLRSVKQNLHVIINVIYERS